MPSRTTKIAGTAILAAIVLLVPTVGKLWEARAAGPIDENQAKPEFSATTAKDQSDLSVTVYNSNIALVRDVRQIRLQPGVFPLRFEDVAASIMPATVHFRSLTDPSKLNVVEQNYEYDLLDPQKLLQEIRGQGSFAVEWQGMETKALLLADNGGPVWKIGDEIVTGLSVGSYRFPELPDNLYSRPTLVWTLDNRGADAQKVEASYLDQQHELERGLRVDGRAR